MATGLKLIIQRVCWGGTKQHLRASTYQNVRRCQAIPATWSRESTGALQLGGGALGPGARDQLQMQAAAFESQARRLEEMTSEVGAEPRRDSFALSVCRGLYRGSRIKAKSKFA